MPRASLRTVLACFSPALILGLADPTVLGNVASDGVATPYPYTIAAGPNGTIRNAGLGGPDRLTAAAVAEAMIPAWRAPEVPRPVAAAPAWRPAPGTAPAPPAASVSSPVAGAAGQEFTLVNQDRTANGVWALSWSATLARVAQYRAQDMLDGGYFSHYDPATGQLAFLELFRAWGIGYTAAGENIAWSTDPSMDGINTLLMNSAEHRENILNPAYGRVGVGVARNGSKVMVVEVFSN
jgi:uncharacterized protein YkwD